MTILTNFKQYTPKDPAKLELSNELGVVFILSDEGVDWYESQEIFNKDDLKIVFNKKTGEIISFSKDVSALWPLGSCVADIPVDQVPANNDFTDKVFDIRSYSIKDKVYTPAELQRLAERKVVDLQSTATALITPLTYAKDLDMITDEESAYLKNLQRYVVSLSRVASQEGYPATIEWPILPTK